LAGADALGERESLQRKIDNGGRLTPVEQGTFDRLSVSAQLAPAPLGSAQPGDAQIHLAQQTVENARVPERACTPEDPLTNGSGSLLPNAPKTTDDFTILNATPQELAEFDAALNYLQSTDANGAPRSETAVELLEKLPDCSTIFLNDFAYNKAFLDDGMIFWDPLAALKIDSNNIQSPAMGLIHEVDHVVNYGESIPTNDGYTDTEERRVITGGETQIANDLGEPTRDSHGGEYMRAPSSIWFRNSD
jgi:hypothetical protein